MKVSMSNKMGQVAEPELQTARNLSLASSAPVPLSGAQRILYSILAKIELGQLTITDHNGEITVFGIPGSLPASHCIIHDSRFYSSVLKRGSIGLGESYMDGWWDIKNDDLANFFRVIFQNRLETRIAGSFFIRLRSAFHRFLDNPRWLGRARRDIEQHYDLGNEFYKLMLDNSMTYSCGYQCSESDTLEQIQSQKYARIYNKLGLDKGGSLVDIGCGWGGMLIYAAEKNPAITGVGLTLSKEQLRFAEQRIAEKGLSDRLSVQLCDYRKFEGQFDYLVSIGMFEHVGKESYKAFFNKAQKLLKENGVGLLHTIGLEEDPAQPSDAWTAKYIFPGTYLPRLDEITRLLRKQGCVIGHIENLRPHYALTLRRWFLNFEKNWPSIQKLGPQFNRRFFRMWSYYLQISEAGFCNSTMELYQILFSKNRNWHFPRRFVF